MTTPRIKTVEPDTADEVRRGLLEQARGRYGYVPGIYRVLGVDLDVGGRIAAVYQHLHLRRESPFTRVQREMLATVVNGLVGGAP